jgi:hypothetical protein
LRAPFRSFPFPLQQGNDRRQKSYIPHIGTDGRRYLRRLSEGKPYRLYGAPHTSAHLGLLARYPGVEHLLNGLPVRFQSGDHFRARNELEAEGREHFDHPLSFFGRQAFGEFNLERDFQRDGGSIFGRGYHWITSEKQIGDFAVSSLP